ncbi:COP9 signalosome (CSN) subunit [Malassezia furfur]|uniref:COP9 signalosome (CSN) subunit n=1 Tax=Malassezia furfur TaxID=55194 RepID=A0ABY8EVY1_MALFU|nr:CSN12 [Malassezia furfur]WFD49777.1 COP9 signalosome (CSN) subunit [Malassezia furfur]
MHAGEFGRAAAAAAGREDGAALAQLLSLHASATRRCCARIDDPASLGTALRVAAPWGDILAPYLAAGAALFHADARRRAPADAWRTAHEAMERAVAAFLRYFANLAPGRWALPALYALLRDAQWVARGADDAATSAAPDGALPTQKYTEACARQLNKAFSACAADRFPGLAQSKKWGAYAIAGQLFRLYFRLKSTALCKNVLRALHAADLPPLDAYPRADRVTFAYYVGRLAFLDEDYTKAESSLAAALAEVPARATRHVERILLYLVAVRLLRGVRPNRAWLARFPRLDALYTPLLDACWAGDVGAFDAILAEPATEHTLVRLGLFLALERARDVCRTRLFRRVWAVSGRGTRLRLALFTEALRCARLAPEPVETEWALATLIAQGRIKGYLAHERQMLVLSASDPFPHASLAMLS